MKGKPVRGTGLLWSKFNAGLVIFLGLCQAAFAQEVGSIAGEFSVSNGTANYSIPIEMPQGVAGMQPELSLNYSSQSGNGYLGLGWSIGGLSAIHRCPATLAQDGVRGSVNLDQDDKYCMDGQRLIVIDDGTYGDVGQEYRTEIDGISKITSVGGALETGPWYWVVKTKAGLTMEFGATNDSNRDTLPDNVAVRIVPGSGIYFPHINWKLNKVTDATGNEITYSYYKDDATGEQYIKRIDYAENSIRFEYEETRTDKMEGYYNGLVTTVSQRLASVSSYAGETLVRSYTPTYDVAPTTSQSRIVSIKECANDGSGSVECLPETTFLYDGGGYATLGFSNSKVNLVKGYTIGNGSWSAEDHPRMMADVDGDGLDDIVGFAGAGVSVRLSSGKKFTTLTGRYGEWNSAGSWNTDDHIRMMADVNGDGKSDVVGFGGTGVSYALSQGDSFASPVSWVKGYGSADSAGGWDVDRRHFHSP
jgi:hypothetical protein